MSIVSNGTSSPISKVSSNGSICNRSRPSTPTSDGRSTPVADRRSDEELVTEERHDVLAWIQVKELTPAGTYKPAPVLIERPMDNSAFALRQGV
jgi:kinesin family protein 1